jgi:hypothetical protein
MIKLHMLYSIAKAVRGRSVSGGIVRGDCTYGQEGLSLKVRVRTRSGRGQFLAFLRTY